MRKIIIKMQLRKISKSSQRGLRNLRSLENSMTGSVSITAVSKVSLK